MTNPTIDETGFSPASLDEVLAAQVVEMISAYGDNVRTDPQSTFGQLLNLFGLEVSDQNELAEYLLQSFDPQSATGIQLSRLVLNAGIQRNESAYSTVTLTCTANAAGSTIPAGSLVKDQVNITWATNAEVIVAASSTNTVTATATVIGANEAAAGTITSIETAAYGWTSVTNLSAANAGQTEEADSTLRLRFQTTVDGTSTVSNGKRFQAVSDLSGVDNVKAVSNNTSETNSDGVPAHHVWTIVDGGTNADVAGAIYSHTAGGVGYHGSTTVSHTDVLSGDVYDVKFTRPSDLSIYVTITLVTDQDFPVDGSEQVEEAVIEYINGLGLGDDVLVSRLYTPINEIAGHYVSSLTLGLSSSPTGTSNLSVDLDEQAVTDAAKIVVVI